MYAARHKLDPMSPADALKDAKSGILAEDPSGYAKRHSKSTIKVGASVYQVVGIGTTPDFMYPIIDASNPVPNVEKQAILFTRKTGYSAFHDAYRGGTTEDYLAFKFARGTPEDKQKEIKRYRKHSLLVKDN